MRDAVSRAVAGHYDRWPFPGGEFAAPDGLLLLRTLAACLRARRGASPRVLDAGCGTGHTVVALARHFPAVAFVGIDHSRQALRQARRVAREQGAANVEFREADLAQPPDGSDPFDAILSLGVVHHMPDRAGAVARLAQRLAPGGRLLLWVYGRHGRHHHNLNQRFLRAVTQGLTPARRHAAATAFVEALGARLVTGSGCYTPRGDGPDGVAWLLERPQWLADQMIPAHEEPFELGELLDTLAAAGLRFERWLGAADPPGSEVPAGPLRRGLARLSARERLLALDCLLKPDHYFVLGRRPAGRRRGGTP